MCKMGWVQLRWPAAPVLWRAMRGHGWVLDGKFANDYPGWPYPETGCLAHGDGGVILSTGDLLTHDPERCAEWAAYDAA